MSKIEEVIINNYKIFGGEHIITLSSDAKKPFTVIVGENASGKSAVGEAIQWALGSEPYTHIESTLNIDCVSKLHESNKEKISVELICETFYGKEYFKREITIGKSQDDLISLDESFYINGEKKSYVQYLTIAEKRFPLLCFNLFVWDFWMQLDGKVIDIDGKLLGKFTDEIDRKKVLNLIAQDATKIFQKAYFRAGSYEIKWNDGFVLNCMSDPDRFCEDLSATDQLVLNTSILTATINFLEGCCACTNEFPIIIDDILCNADEAQFSTNELSEILYPRQVLFMVRKRICGDLTDESRRKYGRKYSIKKISETSACLRNIEMN